MSEKDLGRHHCETHAVEVKGLSFRVDRSFKGILSHHEAPETAEVREEEHDDESSLYLLDEAVPGDPVILTQLEGEERLVALVLHPANLHFVPHVEAILSKQGRVEEEKEVVNEVTCRESSLGVEEQFGGARDDRLLDDDADEVGDIEAELAPVPEKQPSQVFKLYDCKVSE